MKRNFKLLVAVVVLAAMVMTLASCDVINGILDKINPPQPHEHTFSSDWTYDETNHWHAANCTDSEECASQKSDVAAHTYVDGKCVCGAEEPACEHQYTISESKDATCTEAGSKTFACSVCGHSYTQEIAANGHTEEKLAAKAPTCTEPGLTEGKKCSVCGDVLTAQAEINATGHTFVEGVCHCGEADPDYIAPVVYVLNASDLSDKAKVDEEGFDTTLAAGDENFFTLYLAKKTKIESNSKTFADGVSASKRISWQTKTEISEELINAAIEFTVENEATVKIWWVSGGDGRNVAIYKADGTIVAKGAEGSVKNELYITELTVPEAGTYYLGNIDGSNNYYQISVSFFPAPKTYINAATTDNYCWVDKVTFTAEGEGNYTFKLPAGLGAWEAESCDSFTGTPYVNYYSNENGDEFTVGLEAGATLEFYIGSTEKKDWAIEWTYEACEVESESSDTPVATSPLKVGTTSIDAANAVYEYVAPSAANLTLTAGGAIMGPVTITYSVNGGEATTLELSASVTLALAAGDKVVINITAEGYSSITAEWDGESAGGEDEVIDITGSYIGSDDWGNSPLAVVVGADGSVVFTYTHPMMGESSFTATYEIVDGAVVLYNEDGEVLNPLAGSLTITDGVLTGASYNGTNYTLVAGSLEDDDDDDEGETDANEALVGFYGFDDYAVIIFEINGVYVAEVYSDNYDLYFTFEAVDIGDGMYSLMLEYYEYPDYEIGKDTYLDIVLDYSIVITPGAEEEDDEPTDDPNEAFVGAYEFGDYYMSIYYDDDEGCYMANVYGNGFDLYFTFIADDNFDGTYTIFLEYYETDFETGKDEYLEAILNYNFVITVESEEENDDPNEAFVGTYEFEDYYMGIYYDDVEGCYMANVYGNGFDLYFTFIADDNFDGTYTIFLQHHETDFETGKDEYLETILNYNFVITPATEEEEESDPKDAFAGFYEFDEYTVFIFYSESEGVHLAEVYCDNYDLYFTFEAVDIGEGAYALMLEYYARPDWETGKDEYLNTVLEYSIVITPAVEEEYPEEEYPEEDESMVDTILVGTYTFNSEEGSVFTVKFENGYIYVLENTIGLELSESFAYTYSPMTGMVMSDEGYFYVDVTTGDLYYGSGWLLTPVVE